MPLAFCLAITTIFNANLLNCGNHRHKMPLKSRVYVCPDCGHTEYRDLNAAKNIDRWFVDIFIPVA
ncbi:transposase [Anabaena sp. WA102]|uniref:transposase n=1 Tax=Anabaena sp. WA102 TaxID=1647413 RepID=UPI000A6331C5|nr:transposase [Anabaena sp. WA102]